MVMLGGKITDTGARKKGVTPLINFKRIIHAGDEHSMTAALSQAVFPAAVLTGR